LVNDMKVLLVSNQLLTEMKRCVKCGSITTYVDPRGYERWGFLNRDKSKYLCKRCDEKEYKKNNPEIIKRNTRGWEERNPKKAKLIQWRWREKYPDAIKRANGRRMVFKDKVIMLKENPRIGVCNYCRKSIGNGDIKRTQMHHEEYIESNPLKHTIELCVSCHNKTKRRVGK